MDVSINENNANPNKEQQQEQCLLEGRLVKSVEMSIGIKYCCEVLNGKAFLFGGETIIALLDTNTFAKKEISLTYNASDVSCIDEKQIVIFMPEQKWMLNANVSSFDIELGTKSFIPVEHNWTRLARKGTQYVMCTETAVFIYNLVWEKLGTISHLNNKPLFTEAPRRSRRSWRSYSNLYKVENTIRDIVVGESNIIIASEEKLVVTDKVGNIKKTFKPGGNITCFDGSRIFVYGNGRISIVKDTGKFIGILLQDRKESFSSSYCIHYGQICKKLLVSRSGGVNIFSVQ